jgi:hypothetical protein
MGGLEHILLGCWVKAEVRMLLGLIFIIVALLGRGANVSHFGYVLTGWVVEGEVCSFSQEVPEAWWGTFISNFEQLGELKQMEVSIIHLKARRTQLGFYLV